MAFNKDIPTSSTSLKASNPQILANQSQLQEAMAKNHQFEGTDALTQTGKHEAIELMEKADLGTGTEGLPLIGAQTANAKAELVFVDEDDNDIQLTSAGKSGSATTDLLANAATISGDAAVAGTLDVAGNIDPTTYETTNGGFLDEDDMASDLTTSVASQQSIKAYQDNVTGTESDGQVAPTTTGYQFFSINGVSTKVYTKYLTGTLDGDTETSVAHGVDSADAILHCSASAYDDSGLVYRVSSFERSYQGVDRSFSLSYNGTNVIFAGVLTLLQGNKYRIKIEYV